MITSGPPGPGFPKIEADAIPQPRLALPSRRQLVRDRRAGLGPAPTKEGTVSVYAVGAGVLTRPQAFPLQGGRLWRDGGEIPLKLEITSAGPIPPFCILHGTHDSFLMKFSKSRVAI